MWTSRQDTSRTALSTVDRTEHRGTLAQRPGGIGFATLGLEPRADAGQRTVFGVTPGGARGCTRKQELLRITMPILDAHAALGLTQKANGLFV